MDAARIRIPEHCEDTTEKSINEDKKVGFESSGGETPDVLQSSLEQTSVKQQCCAAFTWKNSNGPKKGSNYDIAESFELSFK